MFGLDHYVDGECGAAECLAIPAVTAIHKDWFGVDCVFNGIAEAVTFEGQRKGAHCGKKLTEIAK